MDNLSPSIIDPQIALTEEKRQKKLGNIARNSAAMLSSQILIKALAFLFSVYVVRRLGATDFGLYSSIMATTFIFSMLTDLGTSTLVVREVARKPGIDQWLVPNVMAIRAMLSILMIIGNTTVTWLFHRPPEFVLGVFIASFGLLFYAFQGPLDGLLIAKEHLDFSSLFNVLNQVTFISLGTLMLVSGKGYIGLLIATLAGILIMGVAAWAVIRRKFHHRFSKPDITRWKSLIKDSLPFGLIGVIIEFTARFDIVYMSFVLTFSAVGNYNVSLNLILTVMLIAQSLALAIFPSMVKEYDSGRGSIQDTVQRSMRYLLLLSLPMAIGGSLTAELIIVTLYGQEYASGVHAFRIMVWALPFMYLAEILGRASITMHLERKVASFISVHAVLTITLSLLLIPRYGIVGAAYCLVFNKFLNTLISVFILEKRMLFENNILPLLRVILAGLIMGLSILLIMKIPGLALMDRKLELLMLIGSGVMVYGLAALSLKAISPGEAKYLFQSITRKARRT